MKVDGKSQRSDPEGEMATRMFFFSNVELFFFFFKVKVFKFFLCGNFVGATSFCGYVHDYWFKCTPLALHNGILLLKGKLPFLVIFMCQ